MSLPPSHSFRSKFQPLVFILMVTLTVMFAIFSFGRTSVVNANSTDLSLVEGKYQNIVGTRLDTCALCHTSSIPSLNLYGAAYKAQGRNASAFGPIEALDSDGDGYTNLQEIIALTFPGDVTDHPAAAPTATKTPTAAPTSTQTLVPTQTNTSVPPTATRTTAPTQTRTAVLPTMTMASTQTKTSVPQPSFTPAATNTSAPPPAPTATLTRMPTAIMTMTPPASSGPTATPGHRRKTPRPTPKCENDKDGHHSWFDFFWHKCGGDDHGDNNGD